MDGNYISDFHDSLFFTYLLLHTVLCSMYIVNTVGVLKTGWGGIHSMLSLFWCYVFGVKVKLAGDILEGLLQQVGSSEEPDQHLTLLLAEVYIALVKHCSK